MLFYVYLSLISLPLLVVIIWQFAWCRGLHYSARFIAGQCDKLLSKARDDFEQQRIDDHEYYGRIETIARVRGDIELVQHSK